MPAASRATATSLAEEIEALWRAFSIALTVLALSPARAARCAWFHRSRTRAARNKRPFRTASSGSTVGSWLQQGHHARKYRACKGAFVAAALGVIADPPGRHRLSPVQRQRLGRQWARLRPIASSRGVQEH